MRSLTAMQAGQLSMVKITLLGVAAGIAAALLFATIVSGSLTAIFLFYLAPLPIMIAALGFSQLAGLIAAATATSTVAMLSGAFFVPVALIAFGAWWLGYLALLGRPATIPAYSSARTPEDTEHGTDLEWYPIGRLLLWAAAIGTLVVAAAVPNFGTDQESLHASLRKTYSAILGDSAIIDLLVIAVPPAAAVFSTVTNILNLWLAGLIVKISGRLVRPWPALAELRLPVTASALLTVAAMASLLPDLFGILSGAFAASLVVVFAMVGLAVLHSISFPANIRRLVLAAVYTVTFLIGWPLLLISVVGFAETLFNIRARIAGRRRPPIMPT
jgi:hypothetical protein